MYIYVVERWRYSKMFSVCRVFVLIDMPCLQRAKFPPELLIREYLVRGILLPRTINIVSYYYDHRRPHHRHPFLPLSSSSTTIIIAIIFVVIMMATINHHRGPRIFGFAFFCSHVGSPRFVTLWAVKSVLLAHSLTPFFLLFHYTNNQQQLALGCYSFHHLSGAEAHAATSRLTPSDISSSACPLRALRAVWRDSAAAPHASRGDPVNRLWASICRTHCRTAGRQNYRENSTIEARAAVSVANFFL